MYDFRLNEAEKWIKRIRAKRIALQMPEGLKVHAQKIADHLSDRTGAEVFILADPCYGACDVPGTFSNFADGLIQFGHAEIPSIYYGDDVLFLDVFIDSGIEPLYPQLLPLLKERIGLLTTVQHVHLLPKLKEWLIGKGKKVEIGIGDRRVKYPGQLLGCNISTAESISDKVDQYLYLGSGNFHPLSVSIDTNKEVLILDPLQREVRSLDDLKERILRQRHSAIERASGARTFLILVCTRHGQMRIDEAIRIKKDIISQGRSASIVVAEEFHQDRFLSFDADVYVSTACPRIAIDDYLRYSKPIITPIELEIVLGKREWNDYRMDMISGQ